MIGTKRFLRVGLDDHGLMVAEFGAADRRLVRTELELRAELADNQVFALPVDDTEERTALRALLRWQGLPYDALAKPRRPARATPEPAALADMFPEAR